MVLQIVGTVDSVFLRLTKNQVGIFVYFLQLRHKQKQSIVSISATDLIFNRGEFIIYKNSLRRSTTLRLQMHESGELVLYTAAGVPIWRTGSAVECTLSTDVCYAVFQPTDGNFVLYKNGAYYWATNFSATRIKFSVSEGFTQY